MWVASRTVPHRTKYDPTYPTHHVHAHTKETRMKVFGVGVDVAHIPRFERCVQRHGERFLRRAFHPQEIQEFYAKPDTARAGFLASRWAVKEATYKAFQRYRVLFPEIRVTKKHTEDAAGNPFAPPSSLQLSVDTKLSVAEASQALRLEFSGETQALAKQLQLVDPHVSLSHDGEYAVAYVVLQQHQQRHNAPESEPL